MALQRQPQLCAPHLIHTSPPGCRYVTPGAFIESGIFGGIQESELCDWHVLAQTRLAVYKPGGPMAMELSKNPTVLVVNDTVFAHGGLLPVHGAPAPTLDQCLSTNAGACLNLGVICGILV